MFQFVYEVNIFATDKTKFYCNLFFIPLTSNLRYYKLTYIAADIPPLPCFAAHKTYKNKRRDLRLNISTTTKSQEHKYKKSSNTIDYKIMATSTFRTTISRDKRSTRDFVQALNRQDMSYTSIPGYEFCLKISQSNNAQHCMPPIKPQGCLEDAWENLRIQFAGNTCPNGQKRRKRSSEYSGLCQNTWNQCPTVLDPSMFHGKVVLSKKTEYTTHSALANAGSIEEFSCEDGWMLHPLIKEISNSSMSETHKIMCMKQVGWVVLKHDGKSTGPKLLPCQPKKKCKVLNFY